MEIRIITTGKPSEDFITLDATSKDNPVLVLGKTVIDNTEVAKNYHLDSLLRERDWNITTRLFLKGSKICMSKREKYDSCTPDMSSEDSYFELEENYDLESYNEIKRYYNKYVKIDNLYNKSFSIIRKAQKKLLGDTNNSEILDLDYTNTINLNSLINENDKQSLVAILDISYCNSSNLITSERILIKPFDRKNDDLEKTYSIEYTRDKQVLIESLDGMIRVFPLSEDIKECIILSCTIVYEKYL